MDFFSIIILLGALQGVILSIVFFTQKEGVPTNVLAVVLLTVSLALFLSFLQLNIDFTEHPYLIKTIYPWSLIFMPGLYIYLQLITGGIQKLTKKQLLYFIPVLMIFLYNIPFYFGDAALKIDYFTRVDLLGNQNFMEKAEDYFVNLTVLFFSGLSFFEAQRYKKRAMQVFSDFEKAKTKGILFLASTVLLLSLTAVLLLILQEVFKDEIPAALNFITAIGSTGFIYFIAYYTLIYPDVFTTIIDEIGVLSTSKPLVVEKKNEQTHYHDLTKKITTILAEKELFRNPELTLSELSENTVIPSHLLSKIISTSMNTNFYSLINQYRVEEVKKQLRNKKGRGIMEIAFQSGFNSKSTFYEVFKKDTGLSPGEFIKSEL